VAVAGGAYFVIATATKPSNEHVVDPAFALLRRGDELLDELLAVRVLALVGVLADQALVQRARQHDALHVDQVQVDALGLPLGGGVEVLHGLLGAGLLDVRQRGGGGVLRVGTRDTCGPGARGDGGGDEEGSDAEDDLHGEGSVGRWERETGDGPGAQRAATVAGGRPAAWYCASVAMLPRP
jgi:hypothetical protein